MKNHFRILVSSAFVCFMLLTVLPSTVSNFIAPSPAHALPAAQNPIQAENSLPGTPGWNDFSADLSPNTLSGYGSKISVNHGDSIDFYVTTTAPSFTIDIYRTGYYGGVGARKVTSLGSFPGMQQSIPNPDPVTGIIACNWTKTTTLSIPSNWVTGVYLAKLTSSTGNSSFIFFVVRDDGGHEMINFQTSVTTYQAYNTWGGTSLYNNLTNLSIYKGPHATKVSFDRPFNPGDSNGAGHYFFFEYFYVYWLESQGYDVSYTTDVDTDLNSAPLTNHRAFLSVGHDEYWSNGMRTNVQNAINAGVNAGFFGGNGMYWQIRFEPNAAGAADRVEVGYKDYATDTTPPGPDPQWGVNNAIVTTNWREDPVNKPENAVMGVMFEDQTLNEQSYPFVVQNASSWVYAGTGFVNGSSVPGIVGYEYDKVYNNGLTPAGLTILGNSPLVGANNESSAANATLYTASSGARVFASGTIEWSWGLANIQGKTFANAGIQTMTANILNNFIQGTGPTVALNPTSVNFGNHIVGATSTAQAVTLSNSGSSALSISNIAISGTNASDFAQTNTCPSGTSTLAAGSSCTINVTFTAGALGARSATLTFTDNATDSPQSVALSGTGATAAPLVSLNPTLVNFGNQNVGSSSSAQAVTLTNSGTTPLGISSITITGTNASDFAETSTCPGGSSQLSAGSSCTINVTFSPAASGSRSASLTFADTAFDSPQSVSLSGNATVATTFFSDGFENGNLNAWTLPSSDSTGSRTIESTAVNGGSNALALTNASGQYAYIYTTLPSGPQAQTFTRFYFRVASNLSGGTQLAIARNANGGNTWEVDYNAGRHGLDFYFWNGNGNVNSIFSPSSAISPDTWYEVELQDNEAVEGSAQAWLNGTPLGLLDDIDLSTSTPYARLMFYNSAPGTIYLDDVAVANVPNGQVTPSAGANLNTSSLSFGNQIVSSTSTAQTVTLTNNHSLALSISSIAISGTNAADFSQSNTCPGGSSQLSAGASCTISVTFSPSANGARSASLTFTDNAAGSPQSVALSGTGAAAAPAVSLNPTSVSFSNQNVGSSSSAQAVALTNSGTTPLSINNIAFTGTNAADFAQSNTCPSGSSMLSAGSSCTISVTFSPSANGARSASLTFTDNASDSPQSLALAGTGITPTIYFSDGFESGNLNAWTLQSLDSTGSRTVESTVVDSGSNALAITNASGQYAYIYTALSSAQAQTFTRFYFRFTSTVTSGIQLAMARNANGGNTWEVDYNAGRHGLDFYFWNGSGGSYTIFSPNNVLNPDTWYAIEIQDFQTSTGHAQAWLNGTSLGTVDADLSTSTPYARLMFYDSTPGTIYLDDVAVANALNGQIAPSAGASFNPTSLVFGNQNVGSKSAAQAVTLTNNGSLALSISSIALSGTNASDFAQTNTCPSGSSTLAAGSSCTISVTFTPGANGARSASLTFTDNAAGSPQSVALSGTGASAAPVVSLSPTSVNFGNQNVGSASAAQAVTLTNSGTTPLSISSIALTGTNASDFAQTNTCPTGSSQLSASSSCTISVTFTPGASGARSASLTFTDNASDSPQSLALAGTGTTSTVYFSDGFESGNTAAWTLPNSDSTGSLTVQSTVVNSGSNALAITNASGQYAYVYTALSAAQTQTFTRFSFRVASNVTGGTQLAIARNSNGGNVWEIDYNAGRNGLDFYFWNGSGGVYTVFSPNNAVNPDTWYSVQVQDFQTTTGHAQAWLNGTSLGSVDADLSTSTPYARLMFFDSAPGTIYLDDVSVSNS
jgi:archaellum component FlaF (FlaF/FlaG flagellin family)